MSLLALKGDTIGVYSKGGDNYIASLLIESTLNTLFFDEPSLIHLNTQKTKQLTHISFKAGLQDTYFDIVFDDEPVDWCHYGIHIQAGTLVCDTIIEEFNKNPDQDFLALVERHADQEGICFGIHNHTSVENTLTPK